MNNHDNNRRTARNTSYGNEAVLISIAQRNSVGTSQPDQTGGYIAGGMLAGHTKGAKLITKAFRKDAKSGQNLIRAGRGVMGAPSLLYDFVEFVRAPDKVDAGARLVSGSVGAGIGGVIGSVGGPGGSIVGAALGNVAGEYAYDHRHDIARRAAQARDKSARGFGEMMTMGFGPSAAPRMRAILGGGVR